MKQSALLLILVFLTPNLIYGQDKITYYDAVFLRQYIVGDTMLSADENDRKKYEPVLAKYLNPDPAEGEQVASTFYVENPFIKRYRPKDQNGHGLAASMGPIPGRKGIGAIGALDVTAFADGLAQFLIERGKEELNAAFFRRLQKYLEDYPEVAILFPDTKLLLENINNWEYANVLSTLQVAFKNDTKMLLHNIARLDEISVSDCSKDKCKERVKAIKEFFSSNNGIYLRSALVAGNGLITEAKIPDIINQVTTKKYLAGHSDPNVKNAMVLLNVINNSLRSLDADKHYISIAEFAALKSDSILRDLYLGLIYAELKNKKVVINGANTWDELEQNVPPAIDYLSGIIAAGEEFTDEFDAIKERKDDGDTLKLKDYSKLITAANNVVAAISNTEKVDDSIKLPPQFPKVISYAQITLTIADDLTNENYHSMVLNVVKLLDMIAGDKEEMKKYTRQVTKYGLFAANIAEAENAEQVKEAIKAVAMPSGSFIIKQQTSWNLAINGYIGYCWDWSLNDGKKFINGVYAPIGISSSWGFSDKALGAFTIFASVIDVGGIATYRLANGETDTLKQQVRLESIFSPSAQVLLSVPRLPISFCAGWRYTPKLFYTSGNGFETYKPRSTINVAILVDIPIINIYSRPFKAYK